jgi:predicted amidohydrolase YtcJ
VPVRDWLRAGVALAAGSDSPVAGYEPLAGIEWLVTRETLAGLVGRSQAMTAWEAVRSYTAGGAFVTFDEHRQGTLEPGRVADLAILDADPLVVAPCEISRISVTATVVAGRPVSGGLTGARQD